MKATMIEIALYRSGLLKAKLSPRDRRKLITTCKTVARHVARVARHQSNWTEADQSKAERETSASRKVIRDELRPFLTSCVLWEWKTDPRAGCVLRISDKDNRRDVFM